MVWMLVLVSLVPLTAAAWIARSRRPTPKLWKQIYLPRIGWLLAIGLFAGAPFLTTNAVGTSEAYNYSLATADAVEQFRAGVFPVLVGQSEFAFMGRIHPLRTAPYMMYFAGLLDLLSFRQLNFWALQNLALALSLIGGAFATYVALRRCTGATPRVALGFSALYILSPGVLAPTFAMDLYMTVMTVPFLPFVFCANISALRGDNRFANGALLAASLAATWLAHPPVAFWTSVMTILLHIPVCLRLMWQRRWPAMLTLAAAGALGSALALYSFVSALTVSPYQELATTKVISTILSETAEAFVPSLQPISPTASKLGDFQLGWALWLVFLGSGGMIGWRLLRRESRDTRLFPAVVLFASTLFILALLLPIAAIQPKLWELLPTAAVNVSNQWPMQRLYLLLAATVVFTGALLCPDHLLANRPKALRDLTALVIFGGLAWTGLEAWKFVHRGLSGRQSEDVSEWRHARENINPTIISYAILGAPSTFYNGVIDPQMELRLLRESDLRVLATNWDTPAKSQGARHGVLRGIEGAGDILVLSPVLQLEPHTRYRIDFDYKLPPQELVLQFIGRNMRRDYVLPAAGNPAGFGMGSGHQHRLSLWTTLRATEDVTVQLVAPAISNQRGLVFADFTLAPMDEEQFPLKLESLIPLTTRVTASEKALFETPRLFTEGYAATVNGQPERVFMSPDRLVMVPVPSGRSDVVVTYPGTPRLQAAFWISFISWIGLFTSGGLGCFRPHAFANAQASLTRIGRTTGGWLWRTKLPIGTAVLAIGACAWGWHAWSTWRDAAGPIRMRVLFSRNEVGRSQPLVTTGKVGAGTFLFVVFHDTTHVRLGMDVWGRAFWMSDPIPLDYFRDHEFVISSGALYPPGHPKLKKISPERVEQLRNRITVDLDGRRVLDQPVFSFESELDEVTVGESRIGVSSTEPELKAEILEVERLPITP